ncbi:RNA-binding domain-containing protein, partial [Ramaria rubella]
QLPQPLSMLGVFGLELSISEDDLHAVFSCFGAVQTIMLIVDWKVSHMQHSHGYAFIAMESVQDVTQCILRLNNTTLCGCLIRVDYSVTDQPYASTPGTYLG